MSGRDRERLTLEVRNDLEVLIRIHREKYPEGDLDVYDSLMRVKSLLQKELIKMARGKFPPEEN